MRHTGTPELETDRLLLRRLLPQDAPQMYENWANDPAVTRFLRWEPHKSPAETRELLSAWAELYPNPDYYQWAMVEKATGQVFGSISVYNALLGEPQQKAKWAELDLSAASGSRATASDRSGGARALPPKHCKLWWISGSIRWAVPSSPAAMRCRTPPAAG